MKNPERTGKHKRPPASPARRPVVTVLTPAANSWPAPGELDTRKPAFAHLRGHGRAIPSLGGTSRPDEYKHLERSRS